VKVYTFVYHRLRQPTIAVTASTPHFYERFVPSGSFGIMLPRLDQHFPCLSKLHKANNGGVSILCENELWIVSVLSRSVRLTYNLLLGWTCHLVFQFEFQEPQVILPKIVPSPYKVLWLTNFRHSRWDAICSPKNFSTRWRSFRF
jgi:hypothetical protein